MDRLDLTPVRRRRLYEDIVESLERQMLEGRIPPGTVLPSERELMAAFQVGRPAVREALFALSRMGLVTVANGERAVVAEPRAESLLAGLSGAVRRMLARDDGVRQFQHARLVMEAALAREAAGAADADDLEGLDAALAANRAALDDPGDFARTDVAFHLVLAGIPRNPIFTALHDAMAAWLAEQRTVSVRVRASAVAACEAHEAIARAVRRHDPEAADRAMRAHLEAVAGYYWRAREEACPGPT